MKQLMGMDVVTPKEAAAQLLVTDQTILNWIRTGQMKGLRVGGRFFIPVDELNCVVEHYK